VNLKLKALTYTIAILIGVGLAISICIFLIFTYVTEFVLTCIMVLAAIIMSGLLIYDAVIGSLGNTLGRKNKDE